jgi:hypothetical protein
MWNGLTSFLTYTPGWKPEMLECVGCHTDNRGKIRNPGAYNAIYGYRVGQPASGSSGTPVIVAYASFQYPDVSSSNVCTLCHSGRISGATIKALNTGTTPTVDFSALRTQGPHLMATAGVMFKAVGYEYDGRDYTNPSTYMHDKIGTAAVPNTGMGGPCVGCHMYRSGAAPSHLFSNVNVFVSGTTTITTVSSPVCFQCHAGSSTSLGDILTAEHTAYDAAVSALNTELAFKSLNAQNLLSRTPFYPTTDTDTTGNNTGKNNLGAAFNNSFLNTGRSLTAAYVHNSKYAKRLIYDSIDWLDDNKMNYSVGTTLNAICSNPTPSTWCTQGMPYILPNGVANGAPSERP